MSHDGGPAINSIGPGSLAPDGVHYGSHTIAGFRFEFESVGDAFVRTRIAVDFLSLVQLVLWFPIGFVFIVKHATVGLGRRHWQIACVFTSMAVIATVVLVCVFGSIGLVALVHVVAGVRWGRQAPGPERERERGVLTNFSVTNPP